MYNIVQYVNVFFGSYSFYVKINYFLLFFIRILPITYYSLMKCEKQENKSVIQYIVSYLFLHVNSMTINQYDMFKWSFYINVTYVLLVLGIARYRYSK